MGSSRCQSNGGLQLQGTLPASPTLCLTYSCIDGRVRQCASLRRRAQDPGGPSAFEASRRANPLSFRQCMCPPTVEGGVPAEAQRRRSPAMVPCPQVGRQEFDAATAAPAAALVHASTPRVVHPPGGAPAAATALTPRRSVLCSGRWSRRRWLKPRSRSWTQSSRSEAARWSRRSRKPGVRPLVRPGWTRRRRPPGWTGPRSESETAKALAAP